MILWKKHTPKRSPRGGTVEPWEDIIQIQDDDYDDWCHRQAYDPLGLMSGDEDAGADTPKCEVCDDNGCDMCPCDDS